MSFEDTTDRNVSWYQIVDQIADEVNLTDLEVLPSDPRNASMIKVDIYHKHLMDEHSHFSFLVHD